MEPSANPVPTLPQPIQDVVPPANTLGNPEALAGPVAAPAANHVNNSSAPQPSHNPIAGTAMAQSQAMHDSTVDDHALDGVLKDVTSNIKATPTGSDQPKKKRGLPGIFKRKPKQPKLPPLAPHAQPRPPAPSQVQSHSQSLPSGPQAAQPGKHPLKSGPVQPKKKGKITLPIIAAVIVALILVAVALSAFKK